MISLNPLDSVSARFNLWPFLYSNKYKKKIYGDKDQNDTICIFPIIRQCYYYNLYTEILNNTRLNIIFQGWNPDPHWSCSKTLDGTPVLIQTFPGIHSFIRSSILPSHVSFHLIILPYMLPVMVYNSETWWGEWSEGSGRYCGLQT